jgi:hypothetical protein
VKANQIKLSSFFIHKKIKEKKRNKNKNTHICYGVAEANY